jgi:hypothetical protein
MDTNNASHSQKYSPAILNAKYCVSTQHQYLLREKKCQRIVITEQESDPRELEQKISENAWG